jgi:hypothetical protein
LERNPSAGGFVPAADGAGGYAGSYRIGGNGACYNGVGSDNGAIADVGPGEDGGSVADPDIATDGNSSIVRKGALHRALAGWALIGVVVEAVGVVGDNDATAAEEALSDGDSVGAGDVDLIREIAVGTYVDCGVIGMAGEGGNSVKPETAASREVLSYVNVV